MALLPGVTSLGTSTTHDGQSGVGFGVASQVGESAILVDPDTGQLLEIRNMEDSIALTGLAQDYVAGSTGAITSYGTQLLWLDPVGESHIVQASQLPQNIPVSIFAVAKPGNGNAVLPLFRTFVQQYGYTPDSFANEGAVQPGDPAVIEWEFTSKNAQFSEYLAAAKASGIFSEVDVL
jgi:hypothetical protein